MKNTKIPLIFFTLFLGALHLFPLYADEVTVSGKDSMIIRRNIVENAYQYLGTPYLLTGVDSRGIDCSGLTQVTLKRGAELDLPRLVRMQIEEGEPISLSQLLPGDLIFFNTTGIPSHVAVSVQDGLFVHAASAGARTGVIESSLTEEYYANRIVEARRYLQEERRKIFLSIEGEAEEVILDETFTSETWVHLALLSRQKENELYALTITDPEGVFHKIYQVLENNGTVTLPLYLKHPGTWQIEYHGLTRGEKGKIVIPVESL